MTSPYIENEAKRLAIGAARTSAIDCLSVLGGWQSRHMASGETFGPVFNSCNDLWKWQAEYANARLIAAAPDLLAALKRLLPMMYQAPVGHQPDCRCVTCEARAAIAKAEGAKP